MAEDIWGQRWISADSEIARKYMETVVKKEPGLLNGRQKHDAGACEFSK